MGTLGYMSPEQVKGKPADARSDIFAFGAILYEMLSGKRAFHADSAGETMAAILKEDPPDLSVTNQNISPGLDRIVRHCLEKNPERRFQSASDIAFNLEALSGVPEVSGAARRATERAPGGSASARPLAAGLALLAAGSWPGPRLAGGRARAPLEFKPLTYRRGFVSAARFAPDGQTIVYSAAWDGAPSRIFTTRPEGREATALPLPPAKLLAVSSRGELAILLDPTVDYNLYNPRGTLALVPLSGGSPREVLRDVKWADWDPDGKDLAVVRLEGARQRLEYPPGRLRHESPAWIASPRVAPRGGRILFYEGLPFNGYSLTVIDRTDRKIGAWARPGRLVGSVWSPDGKEVWFPDSRDPEPRRRRPSARSTSRAVNASSRRGPFTVDLDDVTPDGRALVTSSTRPNGRAV